MYTQSRMGVKAVLYAALCGLATGHVKMYFSDSNMDLGSRPVRNANAATSDGSFSVSGPCGGDQAYGANGFSEAQKGSTVTAKINYNGGHRTDANAFSVAFACGAPSQTMLREDKYLLPASACDTSLCPTGNAYPCAAPNGNQITNGYPMQCQLPVNDPDTSAPWTSNDCTMSILDQREWGGCIDLKMTDAPPAPTAAPAPISTMGVYSVPQTDPANGEYACSMTQGDINIEGDSNSMRASMRAVQVGCQAGTAAVATTDDVSGLQLTKDAIGDTHRGEVMVGGQKFELSVNNGNVQLQNVDPSAPMVNDVVLAPKSGGEGNGKAIAGSVTVLFLLAAVGAHCWVVEKRQSLPGPLSRALDAAAERQWKVVLVFGVVTWFALLVCFGTTQWVFTDYCTVGLSSRTCAGNTDTLEGSMKTAGDVMAGCGAMAFLAVTLQNLIAFTMVFRGMLERRTPACAAKLPCHRTSATVGTVLCLVVLLFLTAGWVNYCVEDGGVANWSAVGAEYGPSFGFTVVIWLCYLLYAMMWRNLHLEVSLDAPRACKQNADLGTSKATTTPFPEPTGGAVSVVAVEMKPAKPLV